jgi:hypothetical protein
MLGQISNEVLANIKTVYYHGSCPDGIGARQILKGTPMIVRWIPYYFSEFTEIPYDALFVDCSPKSHQVEEVLMRGGAIAEHHDSFMTSFIQLQEKYPKQLLFGENLLVESGAKLAVHLVEQMRGCITDETKNIAHLLSISDTWQNDDPAFGFARQIAGYIAFFGNDFCMELGQLQDMTDTIEAFGKVQQRKQTALAMSAIRLEAEGYRIAFINELNMSNAAEILRNEGNDIIVGFMVKYEANEQRNIAIFSMRSNDKFDCAAFAKDNGGGGHKAAAGFSEGYDTIQSPIQSFLSRLKLWSI